MVNLFPFSCFVSGELFVSDVSHRRSQWQMALHLLEQMHEVQLNPDVMAFNAAIGACHKATLMAAGALGP